jgi:crotonobetainyl-CoA:carnitine CoA-transferase CaiB-like acyl-CoA transferase
MAAPLAGIRVLEAANWLAAPSCAALMADMGADVVKVEPPGGDAYRQLLPTMAPEAEINWIFELDNRGKRSVTVDLEQAAGQELFHQLLQDADIFITNLTQPRLERYHLTPSEVHAIVPDMIYVSLTGYGTRGPDSGRAGFDHTAFWARSGVMSMIGQPDGPPNMCRGGQGDHATALNLLASSLAALRLRDQTGEGQIVEVTLQNTGAWTIGLDLAGVLINGEIPARQNRLQPANALANFYELADGRWLLLMMPQGAAYWPAFCRALGHGEWEADARFHDHAARTANGPTLATGLREVFIEHDLPSWTERLDAEGLIWAPVAELPEVIEDQALRQNGAFETVEHPSAGQFETLSAPFQIIGADISVRGPAPEPGQHTFDILRERGMDDEQIALLAEQGVFG